MFALSVDGETIVKEEFDSEESFITFENAESAPQWQCLACGEELTQDVDGFADDGGSLVCRDYDPDEHPGHDDQAGPGCGEGPHHPRRVVLSWVNSAGIHADPDEDSITVSISVGDPRGAFTFTVRRIPDDAPNSPGRLVLHTPYPGEPLPHAALTEHHPGTFLIGCA